MKRILTLFMLLMMSFVWCASAEQEGNLAEGCKVEACGFNEFGGLSATEKENPELAVDGDEDTKWDCNVMQHADLQDSGVLHWILLDLGAEKEFNKIVLKHASNTTIDKDFPTYNTREMKLEYSNDQNSWTEFLHILNGDQKPTNTRYFDAVTARYVRLNILVSGALDTDARLAEIEVYNSSETPVEEEDVPLNAPSETTDTSSLSGDTTTRGVGSETDNPSKDNSDSSIMIIVIVIVAILFMGASVAVLIFVLRKTGNNS